MLSSPSGSFPDATRASLGNMSNASKYSSGRLDDMVVALLDGEPGSAVSPIQSLSSSALSSPGTSYDPLPHDAMSPAQPWLRGRLRQV